MTNCLPKLLVTGGGGQLASALQVYCKGNFDIECYSHTQLDIIQLSDLNNIISRTHPTIIINTAAYTAVDKAEHERDAALRANHLGVKNLAIVCEKHQIPLIHISTDYVFDGKKDCPYSEKDEPNPINFYGESKKLGEESIRQYCEKHIILRTSGVFSEYKNNFLKTILRLAKEKKEITIVADQITCPTYASDLANTICQITQAQNNWGTYHYCNDEVISWYNFAKIIITEAKKNKYFLSSLLVDKIEPITSAEYKVAAKRPAYSVLNCDKIQKTFGISQQPLRLVIRKVLLQLTSRGEHETLSTS